MIIRDKVSNLGKVAENTYLEFLLNISIKRYKKSQINIEDDKKIVDLDKKRLQLIRK